MSSLSCSPFFSQTAANSVLRTLLSSTILSYLSKHGFYFFPYFFALTSFFASTWGSLGSGTLSDWVQAFFRHPTLFSFSLAFGDFGMPSLSCPLPSAYHLPLTCRCLRLFKVKM
jgi:hypothetical protein